MPETITLDARLIIGMLVFVVMGLAMGAAVILGSRREKEQRRYEAENEDPEQNGDEIVQT